MSQSLATLLRSLQLAGLDLDAEAALDSLWLALRIGAQQRPGATPPGSTPRETISDRSENPPAVADRSPERQRLDRGTRERLATRAGRQTREVARADPTAVSGRVLTLPRVAALPESRALVKALRPLRRRVVSPGPGTLDIETTVRRAAEEDLWIPSYAAARERWLDVLMVADHGLSMILWKDTIDEFERVLRNSGAFRSVRSWWLESETDNLTIAARGRGASPATPQRLPRLTRDVGRSVVVVISDCVAARWHDGTIPGLMAEWSRVLPVALTQVTPEWFWARTALGGAVTSEFRSTVPAATNHRLRWDSHALGLGAVSPEEARALFRLPAVTLTAAAVARLSGLIAGVGREWAPGVVFDLAWKQDDEDTHFAAVTAVERVARFAALASARAKRLAAAFAACPVQTLGVLRLLRRDLIPDGGAFVEAEVLLGGIMRVRREQARWDLGAGLPLEFVPGVQSRLLDGALAGDVLRVLAHAAVIAESGIGSTFQSWLDNPSSAVAQLDPAESPFATATAAVLERLGGTYAQIVKPQSAPVDDGRSEPEPDDSTRQFRGWPHQLPWPVVFVRRTAALQLEPWIAADPTVLIPTLVGATGIGKSAIAGYLVRGWIERHPSSTVFSWCFQRDPSWGEARRALQDFVVGNQPRDAGLDEAMEHALARSGPRFVVLDGLDGITDPEELSQVLSMAELLLSSRRNHVLLTTRRPLPETRFRMFAEMFEIGPLDEAGLERLAIDLFREARNEFSPEDLSLVKRLSGGNPLLVEFVVQRAVRLTIQGLFEEFGFQFREGDSIDPNQLPSVAEILTRAERARELAKEGRSLLAVDSRRAVEKFGEVVTLRRQLPSLAGKANALFEYGEAILSVAQYERADSSLMEALEIYRSVSDDRAIIATLDLLSQARTALGKPLESVALLDEALDLRRRSNDADGLYHGLVRLASAEVELHLWDSALAHYQEAVPLERHVARGLAYLGLSQLHRAKGDLVPAVSWAQEAVRLFEATLNNRSLAEALDLVAQLEEERGGYAEARAALQRLKESRVLRVYLSSTLSDLEAERAAIKEVLADAAILSEGSLASDEGAIPAALAELARCDVYLLVLGLRYGYVPPGETKSVTHLEFDAASANRLPRLVFIKEEEAIPIHLTDAMTQSQATGIEAFRREVSSAVRPGSFGTVDELKIEVLRAFGHFRSTRFAGATDTEVDARMLHLSSLEAAAVRQASAQTVSPGAAVHDDDHIVTIEFTVSGRVQGVGFRYFTQQAAESLGLRGTVSNLPDGRVRVLATGPRSRLMQLEERLRRGPAGARVEDVSTSVPEAPATATAHDGVEENARRALVAIGIGRTGTLPPLSSAVKAAGRVAEWGRRSQGIPGDQVWLLTDERAPVRSRDIFDVIRSVIERETLQQLIVCFAGYAVGINRSEVWLLSDAPADPMAAVNLDTSVVQARFAGIPHVVFVSDSCRVWAPGISAEHVLGVPIFPNEPRTPVVVHVDRFVGDDVNAPYELNDAAKAAARYTASYTAVCLSALSGEAPSILDDRDGVRFVRPRALQQYLETAGAERLRSLGAAIGAQPRPGAVIESGADAWLARFPTPPEEGSPVFRIE